MNDALIVDQNGNLYASHFDFSTSVEPSVYKVDPEGVVSLYSTGYSSCNGLALDGDGNLYVVDFTSSSSTHRIYKVDQEGVKTTYGPFVPGASGIIFDPMSDTLLVSQYTNTTNSISKLAPDGTLVPFCSHPLLNGPVGMAYDEENNLYVANFNDGEIYRISNDGEELFLLGDVPNVSFWGIGFIAYSNGYIYATGIGTHKIYRVSLDGELSEFAGNGIAASIDGDLETASFDRPNGIAFSPDGQYLYISDLDTESIRRIDMNTLSFSPIDQLQKFTLVPNPAFEQVSLVLPESISGDIEIRIYSTSGKLVRSNRTVPTERITLMIDDLPNGVYVCTLINEEAFQSQELVIAR